MDAQTVAALAIVALCGAYVGYRWLRLCLGKGEAGCHSGGCTACPNNRGCTGAAEEPPKLHV